MKHSVSLTVCLMTVPWAANAQWVLPEPDPTNFEAFLANPAVVVEQEQMIGELASGDSSLGIYALEAQDRSLPGTIVRGVRVDLGNNASNDSVFLDEPQFLELRRQLAMMDDGVRRRQDRDSRFFQKVPGYGTMTQGTENCWPPMNPEPQRIICPNYQIKDRLITFFLQVYGSEGIFPFDSDQLPAMTRAFRQAAERLKSEDLFQGAFIQPTISEADVSIEAEIVAADSVQETEQIKLQSVDQPEPTDRSGEKWTLMIIGLFAVVIVSWKVLSGRASRSN